MNDLAIQFLTVKLPHRLHICILNSMQLNFHVIDLLLSSFSTSNKVRPMLPNFQLKISSCKHSHPCMVFHPRLCCLVLKITEALAMRRLSAVLLVICCAALCSAQPQQSSVKDFIKVPAGAIVLEHVR